jgi:MoxR-like ATPase
VSSVSPRPDLSGVVTQLTDRVVGRRREIEVVVAALGAGRHLLIEGPPGTGKSTLLRSVADVLGVGFEFVEGNAELTPARLVGHFDPARLLAEGYDPEVYIDGPLTTAMRSGSLLYLEEINRIPEETLNVIVTVMSEAELHVPRLGRIAAEPGFVIVAAMNPYDAVGTARISGAIYDRVCRLAVGYQSADEEADICDRVVAGVDCDWVARVVELVRLTRDHPDLRVGSSVRGAIDMVAVATELAGLRGTSLEDRSVSLDAALVALSGRVRIREGGGRSSDDIIAELWESVFATTASSGEADEGKAGAPTGAES